MHEPPEITAKHDAVAASGMSEIESGHLSEATRERERKKDGKLHKLRKPVGSGAGVRRRAASGDRGGHELDAVDENSRML